MPVPTTTERLVLRPITADDMELLYELGSDPRVLSHLPSGGYLSREQTEAQVTGFVASWADCSLGYWLAHDGEGAFVGVGGCTAATTGVWNVYYRVRYEQQRRGYAVELARAGIAAARVVDPDRPVTAQVFEHNVASLATVERVGLQLVWRGPEPGRPDASRLIYADRELAPATLAGLIART
ncbi:MAG TPA: GNAT family N-acetyltransferase [Jatrophihabitans sp.]|jgi:RimJ/RimL family protein N-acetyltransferase